MAQPVIQTSFHSGEWAPALNARVDVAKYHSAVALGLNYFVDYRGGLSSRMGTKYILQARVSSSPVRLIAFQPSFTLGYVLEFGELYMRPYLNGAPILEAQRAITAATKANPCVITVTSNYLVVGDIIYVSGVVGMTQLNGKYFRVNAVSTNDVSLGDLNAVNINSTGYSTYTSGGTMLRVFQIVSPYSAADLALVKFTQNVNLLYMCHPSYAPRLLTYTDSQHWAFSTVSFGALIAAPGSISVATTLAAGTVNYSYTVTAVGADGEESAAGTAFALASKQDLRTTAGTNRVTWAAVTGAIRYNVYKAELSYTNAVASGAAHGFIGDATGTVFDDSNIAPDFLEVPPIPSNPFLGSGVVSIAVTAASTYTSVPVVTIAAPPSGSNATAGAVLQVQGTPTHGSDAALASVGQAIGYPNGVVLIVASVDGFGQVASYQAITYPGASSGNISAGSVPSNPVFSSNGLYTASMTWGVGRVDVVSSGTGYVGVPAVAFTPSGATATATLSASAAGNPLVPQFFNQRLGYLGNSVTPQVFHFSQIGLYQNFDISNPTQPDDAISGNLVSGQLNEIKSAIPMPSGLVVFTSKNAWQLYGAAAGAAISATDITAQSQAYNGASDVPPIIANDHILYVQAKGSTVRDLAYNFYTNVYTGTDISVLSSHLFFGKQITEWCWAEEPFKVCWAIRDDGVLLALTFLKEQDLIGWCHSDTQGEFKSTASVVETIEGGVVDAVYFVVQRIVNGFTVQYIERMADRFFTSYTDPEVWCVDAGLQYTGPAITSFTGAEHLAGMEVVGLADGIPITPFTMATTGNFTLPSAASVVTVGLAYTPDFQTLAIDLGNPTVQGKDKKIVAVTLRLEQALTLQIGQTFDTLVTMKDTVLGNVGTMTNEVLDDLLTGDARTVIDPDWTEPGQYCIRQPNPYPVTILGVIPEITVGDTK